MAALAPPTPQHLPYRRRCHFVDLPHRRQATTPFASDQLLASRVSNLAAPPRLASVDCERVDESNLASRSAAKVNFRFGEGSHIV